MAVTREDQCVGCPPEMGCLGDGCPNRNVLVFTCDECGEEVGAEHLYKYDDGHELCERCLLDKFEKVSDVYY